MTRMHLMIFRLYAPSLGFLVGAMLTTWWLGTLGQSALLAQVTTTLRWLPHALLGLSVLFWLVATVRLRRWDIGSTDTCTCGGMFGMERHGRYGPYRKCIACGRNHALRQ